MHCYVFLFMHATPCYCIVDMLTVVATLWLQEISFKDGYNTAEC